MGWYADKVFPHLMEWVMGKEEFQRQRRDALGGAYGTVLEIGLGTGLNLPHYPARVSWLTAVDPRLQLPKAIEARSVGLSFPVEILRLDAERLSFEDARFDCVVSTWTLCTIPNVLAALGEVRRVLKPGGSFLFLEHGRSEDPKIARWQNWLTPIQKLVACGCHLDRRIDELIRAAGFSIELLERYQMESVPKIGGAMYRGRAVPLTTELRKPVKKAASGH
jgi:ubiquinone/menaquinone biosynthesis C-methylase UbiE